MKNSGITDANLFSQINSPQLKKELEAFVVNSVKVRMIKKLDKLLETEGKVNVRKLFLVPIFTISDLVKRVDEQVPEIKTFFFRELTSTISEAEKKMV